MATGWTCGRSRRCTTPPTPSRRCWRWSAKTPSASTVLGSGILSPRIQQPGGNPFRLESALFRLDGLDIAAEVTRSWFETARSYVEGIQIYGVKRSLEWGIRDHDQPLVFTMGDEPKPGGRHVEYEEIQMPDFANRLPESLRGFTEYEHNGAHGGSHPHLVHEFVSSIVERRKTRRRCSHRRQLDRARLLRP